MIYNAALSEETDWEMRYCNQQVINDDLKKQTGREAEKESRRDRGSEQ